MPCTITLRDKLKKFYLLDLFNYIYSINTDKITYAFAMKLVETKDLKNYEII